MSELTNAKSSLKKILLLIDDINTLNQESYPKLKEQPNNILTSLEQFEQTKNENVNTINVNSDEISALKTKITENKLEISNKEREIESLNSEQQDLSNKIQEVQAEMEQTESEIQSKKEEYARKEAQAKDLKKKIDEMKLEQEKFSEELKQLENELEEKYLKRERYVKNYENRIKAMNLLIRNEYIQTPAYQLLNSLQSGSTLELKNVLMAIDMKESQARDIINKLIDQGAPIEFQEQEGKITLKEEVDF